MRAGTTLRSGTPEQAGMSSRRIQHVRDLAAGWVEDGMHPALVIFAARRGVIVLNEAFGKLTPEPDSPPLQLDSIFPLASMTKPITATAVMLLVEDGLLGLNRPVQDYIPEFEGEGKSDVMVHHLLTHTSGLIDPDPSQDEIDDFWWWPTKADEQTEIPLFGDEPHPFVQHKLLQSCRAPMVAKPGSVMAYCNSGYGLLGEIVQRVSGVPLANFTEKRIFQPLGMRDTHFITPFNTDHRSRVVRRSSNNPFAALDDPEMMDIPAAPGGVHSTATDMAVFGQMFLNSGTYDDERILNRSTVREMTRNQIPGVGSEFRGEHHDEAPWGYGWGVHGGVPWASYPGALMSPETFHHGGAGGVHLWIDPTYELVGVYFSVAVEMASETVSRYAADLFASAITAAVDD